MWHGRRFLPTLSIAISRGKFGYESYETGRPLAGCSPLDIMCMCILSERFNRTRY